jgi:hypothetical protein
MIAHLSPMERGGRLQCHNFSAGWPRATGGFFLALGLP